MICKIETDVDGTITHIYQRKGKDPNPNVGIIITPELFDLLMTNHSGVIIKYKYKEGKLVKREAIESAFFQNKFKLDQNKRAKLTDFEEKLDKYLKKYKDKIKEGE